VPLAIAIGAAAVVGGVATVVSGNKAAAAQRDAANSSIGEQRRQYDQTRADQAPWRETGILANDKLASLYGVQRASGTFATPMNADGTPQAYGGFETSPGYAFRRDEGLKAIDRATASRGLLGSGAAKKAGGRFADGLASSEYENYANHLAQLAGVGQAATQATSAAGQNAANNISQAYTNAGNATASAYQNTGSAINSTLNNLTSVYGYAKGGGFSIPKVGR
jgi:hypothetical protein